jgi:signal peptide peptidase SppA
MNDFQYVRILQAVTATPWAILPAKLAVIRDLLAFRAAGGVLSEEEVRERLNVAANSGNRAVGGSNIAVLPLVGTIIPRADLLTESSGAISVQRFTRMFREAMADPDVGSILIDVDSPGGQVGGVEELAAEIHKARGQKPITAVANQLAASAAYWVASAADELIITPSGEVGSIGVFAMHQDISAYLEKEGVKIDLIHAGKFKTEGNPYEPLTEESRAAIQSRVDEYYEMFVGAVARNRGVKRADVRGGFGEGRTVGAEQAVSLGMADRVATLDETIDRLAGGRRRRSGRSAQSDWEIRQRRLRLAEREAGAVSVDEAAGETEN